MPLEEEIKGVGCDHEVSYIGDAETSDRDLSLHSGLYRIQGAGHKDKTLLMFGFSLRLEPGALNLVPQAIYPERSEEFRQPSSSFCMGIIKHGQATRIRLRLPESSLLQTLQREH
jgi:hypothetical protein